jgi:hypothetical protein
MRRSVLLLCAAMLSAAAVGANRFLWPTRSAAVAPGPQVAVVVERTHFGEVSESDRFEWTVPVENREPEAVAVTGIAGSCECMAVEPQQFTLEPGGRIDLRLTLDLRPRPEKRVEADVWPFEVVLMPLFKPEPGKVRRSPEWKVSGRVRRVLDVPDEVSLGTHSEFAPALLPRSLVVIPKVPVRSLRAEVDRPDVAADVRSDPDRPDRFVVELTAKESWSLGLGDVAWGVTLHPLAADGTELPPKTIRLTGRVVPDVRAEPPEVLYPARAVGDVVEEVVSLRSLTGTPFRVERVTAEGVGLGVEPVGDGADYRMRLQLDSPGEHRGVVTFAVEARDRVYQVAVPVVGTALGVSQ